MKMFVCSVCGYIEFNEAPEKCPVCMAPKKAFAEDPNALKKPADPNKLVDLDKKHIPMFLVKKQCGLIPDGCVDVNIKVGEITHVMEAKHWILWIDIYHNYQYIGRHTFVPEKANPAIGLHLKVNTGKITAIENCNVHGKWMSETEL